MNYENILNQRIQGVKPSGIRKFFDILEEMTDAISLGIGEPDFVTPWHIRDAGIYSLERGHTKYSSSSAGRSPPISTAASTCSMTTPTRSWSPWAAARAST